MASGILSPPPQPEGLEAPPTEHEAFIDGGCAAPAAR